MTTDLSSLGGFLSKLDAAPEATVAFSVEGRRLRDGFHVTEMKSAALRSVDCGRGAHEWRETLVQLLDGAETGAKPPMTAAKLAGIMRAGLAELPVLADGALYFEAAPENGALRKMFVVRVEKAGERLEVALVGESALCKPAALTGCCGSASKSDASASRCCAG